MLTISQPLSAAQVHTYHAEEFSNARDNYYTADQQVRGQWYGRLAAQWGLSGEVHETPVVIITGDYLLEMSNFIVDPHNFQVSWYFGIGGRFAYNHDRYYGPANKRYYHRDTDLGPRVPIGVEARFAQVKPLEVYFEAAPGIDFVDETGLTVDVALGARWFF